MDNSIINRREFLRRASVLAVAASGAGLFAGRDLVAAERFSSTIFASAREMNDFNARFDAKGLPTATFGRTGIVLPKMGLGLGSRFSAFALRDQAGAVDMLNYALDSGFYYWDTAPIYRAANKGRTLVVESEAVAGEVVKSRRKEIFLNTKLCTRNPDEFEASLERSFKLLGTDYLDMMMIHGIESMDDFQQIVNGKMVERMQSWRKQGHLRVIGFSGHGEAAPLLAAIGLGCFDAALLAIDPYRVSQTGSREELVLSSAARAKMGVMMIKTVRGYTDKLPRGSVVDDIEAGIVRSLGLEGASGALVGMDSKEIVDKNVALLRRVYNK